MVVSEYQLRLPEDRQLFRKTVRELRRKNKDLSTDDAERLAFRFVCFDNIVVFDNEAT